DPYRLPWYDTAHDYAVNGPSFARTLVARLDAAAKSATPVANQLVLLGNRLGPSIAACVPAPAIDPAQPLARAVAQLIQDGGGTPDVTGADTKKRLSKTWDESALVTGAVRLAAAVERAGLARFAGRTGFSFDQGTPLGRVVVRDAANDMYPDDDSDAIAV